MGKNFYRILGVNKKADAARIKMAYRRAAKRYHPDISPKDEEKFKEIQEAYETLSSPEKKAVYDQQFLEIPPIGTNQSYSRNVFYEPFQEPYRQFSPLINFEIEKIFDSFWEERREEHMSPLPWNWKNRGPDLRPLSRQRADRNGEEG